MNEFFGLKTLAKTGAVFAVLAVGVVTDMGFATQVQAQAVASFSRIDVSGNARIAADTIRVIANLPTGVDLTPGQINEAKQRLIASGLFESVEIYPDRGRLVIEVVENPTINQINIEGNRRLKDEILLPLLQSQSRRAFSPVTAEQDARAIVEAYAAVGRIGTSVEPQLIRRSDNRVDLVFQVSEARVAEVRRIGFVGNRNFSDRRLRRVLETKQAGIFRAIVRRDTFIQDRLEFDRQKLREFYLQRGYIDFEVLSVAPEFARERNAFLLTYTVREGQQYFFGDVSLTATAPDVNVEDFDGVVNVKSGKVYDNRQIDSVLARLDERAGELGLPFVQAVPRVVRNDLTRTVDIEFELASSPRIFIERIDIEGNIATLDRVIRRQFNVVEGDPLNRREISEATDKIRATGFFGKVDVETREGSAPDQAVVDVNVEEIPTGSLSFGVGFSTGEGASLTASLTERNFLGRGQSLSLSFSTLADSRSFRLNFTEPAWQDRDLLVGIEAFYDTTESSYLPLDTLDVGIVPRVRFPLSEDSSLELKYRLASQESTLVEGETISPLIEPDIEQAILSSVSATYTLDRRNSRVDPTAGFLASATQEFAGIGGDVTFSKTSGQMKYYRSFLNEDVVVSAEVEAGVLVSGNSDATRYQDRFYLGGDRLRGFENRGIGPRDPGVADGDALGGNYFAVARFEASFPIGFPEEYGLFGGVFLDVGSVWKLDDTAGSEIVDDSANVRSAIGVSLFWDTALGPIRVNLAHPLVKEDYDNTEAFRLTLDSRF